MTDAPTDRARLVEAALGQNLHDWLATHRAAGTTWRQLAAIVTAQTRIDVTDVTVRAWYRDLWATEVGQDATLKAGEQS